MSDPSVNLSLKQMGSRVAQRFSEQSIALVGLMGVGKSSIGRKLAPLLGRQFVDSDEEIEAAARLSVSEIFKQMGEAEFRRGERAVIKRIINGPPIVLATGGGSYIDPQTRALLDKQAITVWLDADLNTLWERVSRSDTRPLLKQPNPKKVLANLKKAREPIYSKADIMVTSYNASMERAMQTVLRALIEYGEAL